MLDFQDAVYGPITYDIASLMRDAFLSWDEEFVLDITVRYWQKALKAGLPVDPDFGEFYRAVEWMDRFAQAVRSSSSQSRCTCSTSLTPRNTWNPLSLGQHPVNANYTVRR